VVAPDLLLLDSKLSVPPPRPGFVSRAGLIEKARRGGCRVIGVTAPAGYGKSTLLVEWALAEDRPVVWVSFDRLDDDPALVLSLLASAYARAWPAGAGLITDVSGAGLSVLGRAAPRLASAFRASPVPSNLTCHGCGRQVTRWSSWRPTWPWTRPRPSRFSHRCT
jgi:LuxR family maltose regulon positive regulatory protein